MKKYLTLFTFVCVLFLGMQTASAQDNPETKAKTRTLDLVKKLELSDTQVKQIYTVFLAYEKAQVNENASISLNEARKSVLQLLHPEQQQKYKAVFRLEMDIQRKEKRAISNQ